MLSSISVVSSTNSCSIRAERICSHTSAFVHARNRLYTLCHSPNRSGRSRHGTPVFSQYGIALSISRLLFPGRPPCGFLSGGNWLLILFHCFSLISCRFMNSILLFLHFVHNTKVVEVDHHHVAARQHMIRADVDGKGRFVGFCISVFDKGIITRHLKNGANLHQTAAIGENSKRRFLRDMAGVHWGPPCFGYQGGPQQTPAIPSAKYNYRVVTSRQNVPKQSLSPRIFT